MSDTNNEDVVAAVEETGAAEAVEAAGAAEPAETAEPAIAGLGAEPIDVANLIEVGREKADLKAVRESIGINQIDLANIMNVTVRTIKRWEQIGWEEPPEELWELIEDLVYDHERSVAKLVEQAEADARRRAPEREAAGRDPRVVELPYFKNQDHYEQFPHRKHSQHAWGNAISRRAADILRMRGYRVFFYYPEPGDLDE